jgi:hypothetical protein
MAATLSRIDQNLVLMRNEMQAFRDLIQSIQENPDIIPNKFNLQPYDFANLPRTGCIQVVCGEASRWPQFIVSQGLYTRTLVISETDRWSTFDAYESSIASLKRLYDDQQTIVNRYRRSNEPFPDGKCVTLVIEVGTTNQTLFGSSIMLDLIRNCGRHLQMRIIIVCDQIPPPIICSNIDIVIIQKNVDTNCIDLAFAEYCPSRICLRDFRSFVLAFATQSDGVCVIDNARNSTNIQHVLFVGNMGIP